MADGRSKGRVKERIRETSHRAQDYDEMSQDWPNKKAMRAPVKVKLIDKSCPDRVNEWIRSKHVYSMKQNTRGRCVIISNRYFYDQRFNRHGTEKDASRLVELFQQLSFEVVLHEDKTAKEMLQIMHQEADDPVHKKMGCFVCVICTHGKKEGVLGIDREVLSLNTLTSCMDGEQCAGLRRKPKLFFIQACQGGDSDGAFGDEPQVLRRVLSEVDLTVETDYSHSTTTVPAKVDMLIACACNRGYMSFRNKDYGSVFIQTVIFVFQEFACKEDVTSMLTMVNDLVSNSRYVEEGSEDGSVLTQVCQMTHSLSKKVFFFPGL